MDRTTTVSLTVEEIHEAVRYWLKHVKGIEVAGAIDFEVDAHYDPDDWDSRYPPIHELSGASFVVKTADPVAF